MPLKLVDFIITISALGAVITSFVFVYNGGSGLPVVNLKGDSGEWVFPIDTTETISVSGPLGETIIEIRENSAHIVSSPCPNQTCVAAGVIQLPGQWVTCLPNRVMIYINEAENKNDVDAAAW